MEEYRKAQNPHAPPEPTDEERFSLCVPPLESVRRQCIEAWPGLPPYRATQEAIALRTWLRGLSVQEWKAYKFLPHPAMTPRRMREALPETPPLE